MSDLIQRLTAPFPAEAISWRLGPLNRDKSRGQALAYIDARDVMRRLDDVCGPFGWQSQHAVDGERVTCTIRIRCPETGEWIAKSDGAGATDVEADKGAYSDALKRAAVSWGVGRYLYDTASPWVAVEPAGKSYRIPDSERPKLLAALRPGQALLPPPAAPAKRLPPARAMAAAQPKVEQVEADPFAPEAEPIAPEAALAPTITDDDRRAAIIGAWWEREDYGLRPDVVEGGLARWGWWFLQFAKAAPSLDTLLRLKNENRDNHKLWAAATSKTTATQLSASLATIERGLSRTQPTR